MGTMTKEQIEAAAVRWQEDVPKRARELMDAGAPLNPNRISGFGTTFGDYLEEAARSLIGGRFEWRIMETVNGEFQFFITQYTGEPTDLRGQR